MKTKFAIGCLVQWYEVEIVEEYMRSLELALEILENSIKSQSELLKSRLLHAKIIFLIINYSFLLVFSSH